MKYAIRLQPKFGGPDIYLGSSYPTRQDAAKEADRLVCKRCNRFEIYPIPDEAQWADRHRGFVLETA